MPSSDQHLTGPRITYGFTGKEDPTRKQLALPLSVAADGGLPAWYQVGDGNAADCRAYPAHLAATRKHLQLDQPLMIGDSKLVSRSNMLAICRVQARFVGPTSVTAGNRAVLQAHWEAGMPMTCLNPAQEGEEPRAGRYFELDEKINLWRGKFAVGASTVWDAALTTNLAQQVTTVNVPVYCLHGAHDYTCS